MESWGIDTVVLVDWGFDESEGSVVMGGRAAEEIGILGSISSIYHTCLLFVSFGFSVDS